MPPAFRHCFLETLTHVKSAYPSARISMREEGPALDNSPRPVAPRYTAFLSGAKQVHGKLVAPTAGPGTAESGADGAIGDQLKSMLTA